ncbi:hypothetical protein [Bifidobacterium choerinum]|uniref:Uncharacterized protein n=2 Tax=Bifidobacterium choerinum TaxID=35760 RepID=A0A087AG65_9BIFI|nr:hypothetical protein [Bifidobacterium choerinum]KFI57765.1 hypothetical protein BCHO_0924 [Bifidobacterium choerinum]
MTARCQRAPATHCGVWLTKVLVRLKAMNFDAEGERFSSRLCERRGSEGGTLMDDFNTRLDELQNEIDGLRSDLDDLRDEVETMSERIEEEISRGNKARLAMWAQTEDGKRYLRLKLIWNTFLSLRKVTERDRKAFALKVAGRKPEWSAFASEREGNLFKRLLRSKELKHEFEQIEADWQRRYDKAISPLPHASYFVKGGPRLVKTVEDVWKLADSAAGEGDFVAAAEATNCSLPQIRYRYDAEVPAELPNVKKWLAEHPHADITWPYTRVVSGD